MLRFTPTQSTGIQTEYWILSHTSSLTLRQCSPTTTSKQQERQDLFQLIPSKKDSSSLMANHCNRTRNCGFAKHWRRISVLSEVFLLFYGNHLTSFLENIKLSSTRHRWSEAYTPQFLAMKTALLPTMKTRRGGTFCWMWHSGISISTVFGSRLFLRQSGSSAAVATVIESATRTAKSCLTDTTRLLTF